MKCERDTAHSLSKKNKQCPLFATQSPDGDEFGRGEMLLRGCHVLLIVSLGCRSKAPHTGELTTVEMYSLVVLEAGILR